MEDSAVHTLCICPAWADERAALRAAVGLGPLNLPAIVSAICGARGAWSGFAAFCGSVMAAKERWERENELAQARGS